MTNPSPLGGELTSVQETQNAVIKTGDMINAIHRNVASDIILTTEDKVKLCLITYVSHIEKRKEWITPFGLFIAIITTLITTTFNSVIFEASTWKAIYLICGGLSFIWLVISLYQAYNSKKIENIIQELKTG